MHMIDIIADKKLGRALSKEQIVYFANGAADGSIPDYQLSALLMAIRLNGMNDKERADLTLAMAASGDMVDLSAVGAICVDKHSTGGVGDTTTLILVPLVAACGVPVAKVSGRGLSHTGGTIDKMEAIPGMQVTLSSAQFIKQVQQIGCAVVGQSPNVVPADKALYALRDVTSTVDSLPLIASSIMSKKLASGAQGIVLDVKTGSGALMNTLEDAIALAKAMTDIGNQLGRSVSALVTGMSQPLGTHIGNALEVKEAIEVLQGQTKGDLLTVSMMLGSRMLMSAQKANSPESAKAMLQEALQSGAGLKKLKEMIAAQGGDPRICDDTSLLPQAHLVRSSYCDKAGYIAAMDTTALGLCGLLLGAGRRQKEDVIDPATGFVLHVRVGEYVQKGAPLFTLYASDEDKATQAEAKLKELIRITDMPVSPEPLVYAVIDKQGIHRF